MKLLNFSILLLLNYFACFCFGVQDSGFFGMWLIGNNEKECEIKAKLYVNLESIAV